MRHFVCLSSPVTALTRGVGVTPGRARLVANRCRLGATGTNLQSAKGTAVALAAIAVTADDDGYAPAGAQVASGRWLHRHIGPTGFGWTKPDAS